MTAFVKETARSRPARRTSSTDSFTAAYRGTPSMNATWYAPSRSAATTGGSSLRTGRRPSVSIAWSSVRLPLDRPVGETPRERAVAVVEALRLGAERTVGVRVVLEHASQDSERD